MPVDSAPVTRAECRLPGVSIEPEVIVSNTAFAQDVLAFAQCFLLLRWVVRGKGQFGEDTRPKKLDSCLAAYSNGLIKQMAGFESSDLRPHSLCEVGEVFRHESPRTDALNELARFQQLIAGAPQFGHVI